MAFQQIKKGEEKSLVNQIEQEKDDFSTDTERTPEFDEIGTALNEI
ncbi:hypothetical protein [Neobacillus mesonae]|nr:hypothetical protein [Neobacillus mesonae]MCM3571322.1 hypothetical protein [Neobacillus mesonae]